MGEERARTVGGAARQSREDVRAGGGASDDLDPVWRALASPHRRRILDRLRVQAMATGELAAEIPGLSRFAVMQHLRVLEEGGLVVRRRRGRQRINYLNPVPIQQIYRRWVRRYDRPWTEALVSLRDDVEERSRREERSNGE